MAKHMTKHTLMQTAEILRNIKPAEAKPAAFWQIVCYTTFSFLIVEPVAEHHA